MTATHPRSAADDVAAAMRIASRELGAQHARLYLLGSRARGKAARASDIDIAILPDAPLEPGTLARIREALEEKHDSLRGRGHRPLLRRRVVSSQSAGRGNRVERLKESLATVRAALTTLNELVRKDTVRLVTRVTDIDTLSFMYVHWRRG